jgi:hypothetical protein
VLAPLLVRVQVLHLAHPLGPAAQAARPTITTAADFGTNILFPEKQREKQTRPTWDDQFIEFEK